MNARIRVTMTVSHADTISPNDLHLIDTGDLFGIDGFSETFCASVVDVESVEMPPSTDALTTVYTVDTGDWEHGPWVFQEMDDAEAFAEARRAAGYQADLGDQIVIDHEAAEGIIADEMAETSDDNAGTS